MRLPPGVRGPTRMRGARFEAIATRLLAGALIAVLISACAGQTRLFAKARHRGAESASVGAGAARGNSPAARRSTEQPSFPQIATKNTTRVDSSSPSAIAAAVALAVYPSAYPGTHPPAVTLAPTGDWAAALAASSLMAPPFGSPVLLAGSGALGGPTAAALRLLAPTGERALEGAQLVRVGPVPSDPGLRSVALTGSGPAELAVAIDRFEAARRGRFTSDVIVASLNAPAYDMPLAGYAAESGTPILYVGSSSVPAATAADLTARHRSRIFVIGPDSVISAAILGQLARYGTVTRVGAAAPAENAVVFAAYRDPPCPSDSQCVHLPGSFGWAIRNPGHGYVLMSDADPLYAAASAALSASGSYGPQLLLSAPNTLPPAVLDYFLNYATPGYNQEGPTAAVYNHAWIIGTTAQISAAVQAQVDSLLEPVPLR